VNTIPCTLILLRKGDMILLAKKRRGFCQGNFNGIGGKLNPGETVEDAVVRETKEEIGVTPIRFIKVAENDFLYVTNGVITTRMYTHVLIAIHRKKTLSKRKKWSRTGFMPLTYRTTRCGQMIYTGFQKFLPAIEC
jgi:8-oxo-dGTP pyrophosphatase MutT (NUDIX family)